jgi:hypothetical protein
VNSLISKNGDVGADGDKERAALEPMPRVGFVWRQDPGRLAAFADAANRFIDERLHRRIRDFARVAERCVQVRRPDKYPVDSVDCADRFDVVQRDLCLHLNEDTDLLVRAPCIVLHPPEARSARGARDAT